MWCNEFNSKKLFIERDVTIRLCEQEHNLSIGIDVPILVWWFEKGKIPMGYESKKVWLRKDDDLIEVKICCWMIKIKIYLNK